MVGASGKLNTKIVNERVCVLTKKRKYEEGEIIILVECTIQTTGFDLAENYVFCKKI